MRLMCLTENQKGNYGGQADIKEDVAYHLEKKPKSRKLAKSTQVINNDRPSALHASRRRKRGWVLAGLPVSKADPEDNLIR